MAESKKMSTDSKVRALTASLPPRRGTASSIPDPAAREQQARLADAGRRFSVDPQLLEASSADAESPPIIAVPDSDARARAATPVNATAGSSPSGSQRGPSLLTVTSGTGTSSPSATTRGGASPRAGDSPEQSTADASSDLSQTPPPPSSSSMDSPVLGRRNVPPSHKPSLPGNMVLKRDLTPIREKLKERTKSQLRREVEWREVFNLDASEFLVGDWAASHIKGAARQGRLFVFTEHLCFFSALFGVKTTFTIPFVDILSIEKTVEQLTPGFVVRTATQELHFGGIYTRAQCLDMINSVWKGSYVLVDVQQGDDAAANSTLDAMSTSAEIEDELPAELLSASDYGKEDGFLNAADELQELLTDEFNVTPTKFFQLFVANETNFEHDYHVTRGDTDVKVGPWKPHPQYGTVRDVSYTLKLSAPMGPPTTRTEEVHRYHLTRDRLIIDTSMQMLDAPYGDYFRVESQWVIQAIEDGRSSARVSAKAVFSKSTMLKGTISSRTLSGMTESFGVWMKNAHALLERKNSAPSSVGGTGAAGAGGAGASTATATTSSSPTKVAPVRARGSDGVLSQLIAGVTNMSLTNALLLCNVMVNLMLVWVLYKIANRL